MFYRFPDWRLPRDFEASRRDLMAPLRVVLKCRRAMMRYRAARKMTYRYRYKCEPFRRPY